MSKKLTVVALTITFAFSLSVFARAQSKMLPPQVKQALHEVKVLKVNSRDDLSKLWQLKSNPDKVDIVKLNLSKMYFTTPHLELLKNWVEKGNTVWVTYPREGLYKVFGVKVSFAFPNSSVLAKTVQKNELCTDVEKVMLKNSKGDYPKIKSGHDLPLLEGKVDNSNEVLAAVKYLGSGTVYAVPEFAKNQYDGKRFYVNLLEFGAGYPVPPSIISGTVFTEPPKKHDKIILQNGDVLSGEVLTRTFEVKTNYGEFTFSQKKTTVISQQTNFSQLKLKTGDQLTGTIKNQTIKLSLVAGGEKTIDFKNIKKIVLSN